MSSLPGLLSVFFKQNQIKDKNINRALFKQWIEKGRSCSPGKMFVERVARQCNASWQKTGLGTKEALREVGPFLALLMCGKIGN